MKEWRLGRPLRDKVAVVTGASRGAGKAIACVLGEAGATVYVTGRSVRGHPRLKEYPGTIQDTAEEVTRRGGKGIAVRCDHTKDSDVRRLFERVKREQHHVDILVNNVWGGYEPYAVHGEWFNSPFFVKQSMERWEGMFTDGLRAHLVTNLYGIPLMLRRRQGLVVSTTYWDRGEYLGLLFYDVAKCAINRMAFGLGEELRKHGIASVAISPGWMRVERMYHRVPPRQLKRIESPEYLGRAIVALALDPHRMKKTGQTLEVGALAKSYGFTDIDDRVYDYHSAIRDPRTNPHR
ncbi:MAG: SDR family NAD(P)-dependent oxidoreductase [Thermoplasmata archaeon]|nr:SDR family NAD(P)-dependent oxidoreductase [Thermoplasmata archaeon]